MDPHLRDLERARANGDVHGLFLYGVTLRRLERYDEAQQILLELLRQDPTNHVFKEQYIAAKGFWPERIKDEHLGDAFLYHNVNVNAKLHTIIQGNELLDGDYCGTWNQWTAYSLSNNKGIRITSAPLEGGIKLGWFGLREHPAFRDYLQHYTESHRRNENNWPLYGKIVYGDGNGATIEEYTLDGKIATRELEIPTLNQNQATLARAQPESQLGTTERTHNEVIAALFGAEPDQLVAAFQYFTARRDNGNMREVWLWTLDQGNRQQYPERALVLGDYVDGFGFDCDEYIENDWPALGWRPYAEYSRKED